MREFLFRGFHTDENGTKTITIDGKQIKGEWVEGCYVYDNNLNHHIRAFDNCYYAVIPETVGQFTGLTAKNDKMIFEGDIMRMCSATYPCVVYWDGKGWAWSMNGKRREIDLTREIMEIIGNIHDNPELLEEEK